AGHDFALSDFPPMVNAAQSETLICRVSAPRSSTSLVCLNSVLGSSINLHSPFTNCATASKCAALFCSARLMQRPAYQITLDAILAFRHFFPVHNVSCPSSHWTRAAPPERRALERTSPELNPEGAGVPTTHPGSSAASQDASSGAAG